MKKFHIQYTPEYILNNNNMRRLKAPLSTYFVTENIPEKKESLTGLGSPLTLKSVTVLGFPSNESSLKSNAL